MDVNGALQDGVGRFGVHGVEHAMDHLVDARPKEHDVQDLLELGVDQQGGKTPAGLRSGPL